MTGDGRFLEWARRIGDAYIDEVLPGNFGVPGMQWDFAAHTGDHRLRLRDHGNETVVGLTLLFALEQQLGSDRAPRYRAAVQRMLDRILAVGHARRHALQRGRTAKRSRRSTRACRTTGATSTARSTPTTR